MLSYRILYYSKHNCSPRSNEIQMFKEIPIEASVGGRDGAWQSLQESEQLRCRQTGRYLNEKRNL